MATGKRTRIMLGLLGAAVLALVTDQLLPAESGATPTQPTGATSESESTADFSAPSLRTGPTLADRFAGFDHGERPIEDAIDGAFAPLPASDQAPASGEAEAHATEPGLRLSAVLSRDDDDIAVINGRPMRIGEEFEGVRVIAIDGQQVRVETSVGEITLDLLMPSLQSR
ncbi:MAG: hypothetical protein AAFR76_15375 [Planctomycetota bacterium]